MDRVRIGIVGAAGRGSSFFSALNSRDAHLAALCDTNRHRLAAAANAAGVQETYTSYEKMLDKAHLDAVLIATPMHLHASQAIMALARDIHVLSEVTAAVSLEEAKALVRACQDSRAVYMLAENCCYLQPTAIVREIARSGLLGELYYAEGEYIHDVKELLQLTPWRRKWQFGINGSTYCTHSLGPICQWMGQRVVSVSCVGSGNHHRDQDGVSFENEDTTVMLCRMERGGLVEIRQDLVSPRPYSLAYRLQGTEGCCEVSHAPDQRSVDFLKVCILSRGEKWMSPEEVGAEFMPDIWRNLSPELAALAHGGSDGVAIHEFVSAIRDGRPPDIGIYEAMDMTLPGLISQQSILQGSAWLPVPDARTWRQEEEAAAPSDAATAPDTFPEDDDNNALELPLHHGEGAPLPRSCRVRASARNQES